MGRDPEPADDNDDNGVSIHAPAWGATTFQLSCKK